MNKNLRDALAEAGLEKYADDLARLGYEKASDFQYPGKVKQDQKDAFIKFAGDDLLPLVRAIEKATGKYWGFMMIFIFGIAIATPVILKMSGLFD